MAVGDSVDHGCVPASPEHRRVSCGTPEDTILATTMPGQLNCEGRTEERSAGIKVRVLGAQRKAGPKVRYHMPPALPPSLATT